MSDMKPGTISVGVNVDTDQMEDAIEKADELAEAMARIAPMVSIIRPSGCSFYINFHEGEKNGEFI